MLSSRYIHLHEALGLGVMWLQQGAKWVQTTAPVVKPVSPAPKVELVMPKVARQLPVSPARIATMAAIGSPPKTTPEPPILPSQPESVPASPILSMEQHQQRLVQQVRQVKVVVVSICPAPEDCLAGQLFSGEVGVLLNKMLAAIGLQPTEVHKTSWLDTTVFSPNPSDEELAAAQPRLQTELALAAPQAILFLGQFFTQTEQQARIAEVSQGLPSFTVPHPARLLRQPHLKASAWETLQQLQQVL